MFIQVNGGNDRYTHKLKFENRYYIQKNISFDKNEENYHI